MPGTPLLRWTARQATVAFSCVTTLAIQVFVRSANATMASADFPMPLSEGISPGQVFFLFAPLGSTEGRQ